MKINVKIIYQCCPIKFLTHLSSLNDLTPQPASKGGEPVIPRYNTSKFMQTNQKKPG